MTDLVSLASYRDNLQAGAKTYVDLNDAEDALQELQAAYETERVKLLANIAQQAANINLLSSNAISLSDEVVGLMAQARTLQNQLAVALADVHATVGATAIVSRTVPAVSFVENPPIWNGAGWAKAKVSLAQSAGAYKVHLYPFGLLDPWPDPAKPMIWTGNRLPVALAKIREVDANAPIILTLYRGPWWTMTAGDVPLTAADAYSDKGRVNFEHLRQWLQLVDAAVERASIFGVHDFEIWNELKGYYTEPWDVSMTGQAGKPVGYGYFYAATSRQIDATMLRLGIARTDYRIAGPYTVFDTRGDKTSDALPLSHPLAANSGQYGYIQKQAVQALRDFLKNAHDNALPLDMLSLDASTWLKSGAYPSSNPFDYIQKFDDILTYAEICLTEFGFDPHLDKIFSELYPTPDPTHQTLDSEQLRAALWAEALKICVLHGVRYPIAWGPTAAGTGGIGGSLGGLIAADGTLQATGRVFKLFREHFGRGVTVYPLVCSDSRVDGLASDAMVMLWNKTADALTVAIGDKVVILQGYDVEVVTRG